MTVQIIRGNALHLPIADESVDLVCTSPPYFGLRSYQDGGQHYAGQLGSEATPAEFVDALIAATAEMVRVLKPSGSIWVNLGDKYAGQSAGNIRPSGIQQTVPGVSEVNNRTVGRHGIPKRNAVRDKSLLGIPWRYALACIDQLGLILRAEIIWSKPNGLPESVTDRVRRSHESWFHLVKQPRYYSAVDEIREEAGAKGLTWAERKAMGVTWTPGIGTRGTHLADGQVTNGNMAAHSLGKLPGSVWTVPTEPLTVPPALGVDHFAAYPTELPRRIISGWTPPGICTVCRQGRRSVAFVWRDHPRPVNDTPSRFRSPLGRQNGDRGSASATITGYACDCTPFHWELPDPDRPPVKVYDWHLWTNPPATYPALVVDPFGGTGTTCLVADVLGRHAIHIDLSADYNRLARWRINDPASRAKAARVDKPPPVIDGQLTLGDL